MFLELILLSCFLALSSASAFVLGCWLCGYLVAPIGYSVPCNRVGAIVLFLAVL